MGGIIGEKEILGMGEVGSWFPSVLRVRVAEPFDKVFEASATSSSVKDRFNFIFIVTIDLNWRRSVVMGTIRREGSRVSV